MGEPRTLPEIGRASRWCREDQSHVGVFKTSEILTAALLSRRLMDQTGIVTATEDVLGKFCAQNGEAPQRTAG